MDVRKIPIPEGVDQQHWATTYMGCGFVIACDPSHSQEIIDIFSKVSCAGAVVGKVDDSKKLRITDGAQEIELFDFSKDIITGVKVKK